MSYNFGSAVGLTLEEARRARQQEEAIRLQRLAKVKEPFGLAGELGHELLDNIDDWRERREVREGRANANSALEALFASYGHAPAAEIGAAPRTAVDALATAAPRPAPPSPVVEALAAAPAAAASPEFRLAKAAPAAAPAPGMVDDHARGRPPMPLLAGVADDLAAVVPQSQPPGGFDGQSAPAPVGAVMIDENGLATIDGIPIQHMVDPNSPYGRSATRRAQPFKSIVAHHTRPGRVEDFVRYQHQGDPGRRGHFGYHFYIGPDGSVVQGAPLNVRTNHVLPDAGGLSNADALGLSFVGAGQMDITGRRTIGSNPTPEQEAAGERLVRALTAQYGIDPSRIYGHGELQRNRHGSEGTAFAKRMREALAAGATPAQARAIAEQAPPPPSAPPTVAEFAAQARPAEYRGPLAPTEPMPADVYGRRAATQQAAQAAPQAAAPAQPPSQARLAELLRVASNPHLAPEQRSVVGALLEAEMRRALPQDPMAQRQQQFREAQFAAEHALAERRLELERMKMRAPGEYDQRAAAAARYGLQPGTPQYQNYVLTGKIEGQAGALPDGVKLEPGTAPVYENGRLARVEPIPGSGVEMERAEAARAAEAQKQNAAESLATVRDALKRAREEMDSGMFNGAGALSTTLAAAGWPASRNLNTQLDVIRANLAIDQINKLRASGGSTGTLSDADMKLFQDAAGALDPNGDPAELRRTLDRLDEAFGRMAGEPAAGAQSPMTPEERAARLREIRARQGAQ